MKAFESVEKLFGVKRKSFHFDEPMRVIHMLVTLRLTSLLYTLVDNVAQQLCPWGGVVLERLV
jgi:hypothetical protein